MTEIAKESTITVKVGLDENKHPKRVMWSSDDNPSGNELQEAKGMLISFFDKEHLDTYKIDLWTHEMQIAEMDRFIFQTLRGLSDTYHKATGNAELANDMRKFVQYFGEKTKILSTEDQ